MPIQDYPQPQSTAISNISYETESETATITFAKTGEEIQIELTPGELREWLAAPSIGRYYALMLKGR